MTWEMVRFEEENIKLDRRTECNPWSSRHT